VRDKPIKTLENSNVGQAGLNKFWAFVLYPFTVVEVLVMVVIWAMQDVALRLYYADAWYPQHRRTTDKYERWARAMDSNAALRTMLELDHIAASTGTRTCWISGTLLGLERQNRPLDFDHDLDLGLFVDDPTLPQFFKKVELICVNGTKPEARRLSSKCFLQNPDLYMIKDRIARYTAQLKDPKGVYKRATKIDFFLHFPYRQGQVHLSRNSMWWNADMSVRVKTYGEHSFVVPADTHRYLTENYGDYKTESKEFENAVDCPNALSIFSWVSFVYLLKRKNLLMRLSKKSAIKKLDRRIKQTLGKGLLPFAFAQTAPRL
jgi:hypothetical protein